MDTEQQPPELLTNDQEPSAEYWQAKVERLQEAVCFLLMKNQTMRMKEYHWAHFAAAIHLSE